MRLLNLAILTCFSLIAITACGSSNPTPNSATQAGTSCAAGQVFSVQYGCLAQGACQAGFGMLNSSCVQVSPIPGTATPGNAAPGQSCPAGTYSVANVGCLSQGPCLYGYVSYQNQCYQLVPTNSYYYHSGRTRVYGGGGFVFKIHFGN